MKTIYTEKHYKELAEGEHFWTVQEDCGFEQVKKTRNDEYWDWSDGESCIIYRIDPDRIVWVEVQYKEWPEYLIPISCSALVLLIIAFFCYAIWKG